MPSTTAYVWLLVVIFCLLPVLAGGFVAWNFQRNRRLLREGHRVPGEIVDVRVRKTKSGESFTPIVRYRTRDGRELISSPGWWHQSSTSVPRGQLTVIYDEARPTRIMVETPEQPVTQRSFVIESMLYLMVAVVACVVCGVVLYQVASELL